MEAVHTVHNIQSHMFNVVVDSTCREASPSLRKSEKRRMVLIKEISIQEHSSNYTVIHTL